MKKLHFVYILYFFFPLVNLIAGLMTRYNIFPITIGVIIRVLLLIFMGLYVLFISKSKYKKTSIIYFISLCIFAIIYLLTRENAFNIKVIYNEANYLFKFLYYPILFFGLLNLIDEYQYDKKKWQKIFMASLTFYLIFIIIPILTKTSFSSYIKDDSGMLGWFYAANEVGPILLLLFPIVFSLLDKNKLGYLLLSTLSIFIIMGLLTKVSRYGLIFIIIIYLLSYFIFIRKKWESKLLLLATMIVLILFNLNIGRNIISFVESYNKNFTKEIINVDDTIKRGELPDINDDNFITLLLSSRNIKAQKVQKEYQESNYICKLFGVGFYNLNTNESYTIEMDFFDIFYHFGIVGFILLLFPYLFLFYQLIKSIKKHQFKFSHELVIAAMLFLLTIGISFTSGHVVGSPAVSTLLAIYSIYICACLDNSLFKQEEIIN